MATEDGFAMPLVLAVILSLSVLLSLIAVQTQSVRERAESYIKSVDNQLVLHTIEQDIVYRALLEQHGRELVDVFAGTFVYTVRTPDDEWRVDGQTHVWTTTYAAQAPLPTQARSVQVKIQETAGLLDLNYLREPYLRYIAGLFDIPATRQRLAVRDYVQLIRSAQYPETNTQKEGKGLSYAYQICTLPVWRDAEICRSPHALRHIFVAGVSLVPSDRVLAPTIQAKFLRSSSELSPREQERAWEEYQRENGFYEISDISSEVSNAFIVSLLPQGAAVGRQFKLSLAERNGIRPYSISDTLMGQGDDIFGSSEENVEAR